MHGVRTALPDLSIRQLEYLLAVADHPTWAAAAASVGVSASALSQGLAELERRVGVPLFDRDGRRRVLRPAAAEVLAHARQVVALTRDLATWADRARTGASGRLRIGMIDAAAVGHFSDHLRSFRAAHPELEVLLTVGPSGAMLDQLEAGRVDLAVCVDPRGSRRGVDVRPLLTEDIAVYSPDGRRPRRPTTWGPWVLFPEGSHTRALIRDALEELGAPMDVVAESHQPEVLRAMVGLGLGWTVLPVVQAETGTDALANGRVIASRDLVAATRTGAATDPAVALLLERLAGEGGTGL
ncbi:MAG: LysR family transcriptional regulator [Acidimicrobiales bacterium]|nr:MAG: LysR family transcriptional regulator [Acidimicrobiales bacterium]